MCKTEIVYYKLKIIVGGKKEHFIGNTLKLEEIL
jgi:hypothetical protein